ncbi:MAG: hypothetical protein GEV28_22190 [Actinophytocola sp.]|uniref:hypothetical protein n=1 Tax=Actinophytocola sp. TaxID=1872138 RepID=UPI00132A5811|nr:hypothetical protein [Actinophytocola sp.]MPZ82955.1 hypothetical protein [Actinophytocola sp.]
MTDTRPDALRRLDPLTGRWAVTVHIGDATMRGQVSFEWQEGLFLVARSTTEHAVVPDSVLMIGVDDTTEACAVLYTDSRGVHRIYRMSVADGVWRQWRDAPGFAQRFTGTFADGGDTINAAWEKCFDGTTWEHDFDMTYRRQG